MPLISTITTYKKYVRLVFTSTTDNGMPNMESADRKYLIPILGQDIYDALLLQISTASITWDTLLDICRCYVAPISLLEDLPERMVQLTDSGIKKTTSQDMENVFKWEYLEFKNSLESKAAQALDELWQHLMDNAVTYTWSNPVSATTIFKTAADFKKYYPSIQHPFRVFAALQPVMVSIQDQWISDAIGREFLDSLISADTPGTEEAAAIVLLKKAMAYLTISAATLQLSAALTAKGFTVLLSSPVDDPYAGQGGAPADRLSTLRESTQKVGAGYVRQLKDYLDQVASSTVLATYFNSDKYTAPGTVSDSPNESRTGIFSF